MTALASGAPVSSNVVVLSVGMEYRRLAAAGVGELLGAGVFYAAAVSEARPTRGQPVYGADAGNSAGQAATYLAKYAEHVTILVRGHSLSATMSDYLIQQIDTTPGITVCLNIQVTGVGGAGHLEHLTLRDAGTGNTWTVEASALFVLIGAQPNTGWLAGTLARDTGGFLITGPDLCPGQHAARLLGPAPPVPSHGDQHSRRLRGQRRSPRIGEAGGIRGRRRRERGPARPPAPRRDQNCPLGPTAWPAVARTVRVAAQAGRL